MVPTMVMQAEAIAANRYAAGVMMPILIFQKVSIAANITIAAMFTMQFMVLYSLSSLNRRDRLPTA